MSDKVIDRLAKICAMLSSSHDGERASAALLATQILSDLDITWQEVIHRAFSGRKEEAQSLNFDEREPGWHVPYCRWLLTNKMTDLNDWEIKFLSNLCTKFKNVCLTEKQAAIVEKTAIKHGLDPKGRTTR